MGWDPNWVVGLFLVGPQMSRVAMSLSPGARTNLLHVGPDSQAEVEIIPLEDIVPIISPTTLSV